MKPSGHKKVKAAKRKYHPAKKDYFQVDQNIVTVGKNEFLDLEIECPNGFSVFVPFPGIFHQAAGSDQVFNAMPVMGKKGLWEVRIQRLDKDNPHDEKEFAYCIYIKEHDDFAVAASPPRMNIHP